MSGETHYLKKFRIMILGNKCVGKTNLIAQFINNVFREEYYPTSGFMYLSYIN